MDSFTSVTIDAGVLAAPRVSCTTDDVHKYVDTLLDWSILLDEPWIAIYMSERASEALADDGLFPLRSQLQKIFNTHGIIEYDANTVATITSRLLTITPYFETFYEVEDVLYEDLKTDPDIISLVHHKMLQSDLARCITLVSVLRKHCSQPPCGHIFIIREVPTQVVLIKAQIHDLEHNRDDIPTLPSPPALFEGDLLVCDDFQGLIHCLDETAVLSRAVDELGIQLSIRIALFKNAFSQGEDPDWSNSPTFSIGQNFRKTCQQCCADNGDSLILKILRSIVETIENLNLSAVHALRVGAGGNSPQRMRGSDKAQRRDIDREFHLHYWECGDGTIELASVVYHNDFGIPR